MQLVFATKNKGKIREIQEILNFSDFMVVPMCDVGIDIDVVEDGVTFEENALKKATTVREHIKMITLADDSGLEIDYLDKAPGIFSARYLGLDTPYDLKNNQILEFLKSVPMEKRTARFVCVIAAALSEKVLIARGTVEGFIAFESKGNNGFGYDPIFYVPEKNKTMAELSSDEKNEISHRGRALRKMKELLLLELENF